MNTQSYFYIESLSPLWEDVQSSGIFPDSKFFVDCEPRIQPKEIVNQYLALHKGPGFDLKAFVAAHFDYPQNHMTGYQSDGKPIEKHLSDLWAVLRRDPEPGIRGTLLPMPHPYIVPGGRFREVYYWDTYFTILGLQVCRQGGLIENMVDNFAFLIRELGFIPNGNRTYYLGRSQPPFFSLMTAVLAEEKGEASLLGYLPELEREYGFWMQGAEGLTENNRSHRRVVRLKDGSILNRYWDDFDTPRPEAYREDLHMAGLSGQSPGATCRNLRAAAESGWDFSGRWLADGSQLHSIQTTSLIPVDLNCLILHLEQLLRRIYGLTNNTEAMVRFDEKISRRKKAIQTYCWNSQKGFYFDYNHQQQRVSDIFTLAAAFPLFFGLASQEQATAVAAVLEEKFLFPGGLVTTLDTTGQQWDAPNGWAPLQWITYMGLRQYGFHRLAGRVKKNWMGQCLRVYEQTGKMMEKYNVMDTSTAAGGGEYPNQDGFGWTNGVYLKLLAEPA